MTLSGTPARPTARGTFPSGEDYLRVGTGPRTVLMIQGGPGSGPPSGLMLRGARRLLDPFLDAGYTMWVVSRRRHMPEGHTIEDMADDYAALVRDDLGGRVDVAYGEETGGLVTLSLAARHPDRLGRAVVVAAAWRFSDWGIDVDLRFGAAMAAGHRLEAGRVIAEGLLPAAAQRWLGPLLAPVAVFLLPGRATCPPEDYLIEARAQQAFDGRAALPGITVPVLLISGDRDPSCPREVVQQTADLIPGSRLVWYEGAGHLAAVSSHRIPEDVLAFASPG